MIKLPIVMALYAEAAAGRLSLDERVAAGGRVDGSGVLRHLADVAELSLRDLATLTVIVSDNTATNRLIERLGFDVVNRYLDAWGCPTTRLRRAMYEGERKRLGIENVMTARETVRLLGILARGELVDRGTSDAVLGVLARTQDELRLRRYLPDGAWVVHKSGWDEGIRNDAGVVRGSRPVLVAGLLSGLASPHEGDIALGVLGWCAYRAGGGEVGGPPSEGELVV